MYTEAEGRVHERPGGSHPAAATQPRLSLPAPTHVCMDAPSHTRARAEELCVDTNRVPGAHDEQASHESQACLLRVPEAVAGPPQGRLAAQVVKLFGCELHHSEHSTPSHPSRPGQNKETHPIKSPTWLTCAPAHPPGSFLHGYFFSPTQRAPTE